MGRASSNEFTVECFIETLRAPPTTTPLASQSQETFDVHSSRGMAWIYQLLRWLDELSDEMRVKPISEQMQEARRVFEVTPEEIQRRLSLAVEDALIPAHQIRAKEETKVHAELDMAVGMLCHTRLTIVKWDMKSLWKISLGCIFLNALWQNEERILSGMTKPLYVIRLVQRELNRVSWMLAAQDIASSTSPLSTQISQLQTFGRSRVATSSS